MTMQSDDGRNADLLHSVSGQLTLLAGGAVALLIVGWLFVF